MGMGKLSRMSFHFFLYLVESTLLLNKKDLVFKIKDLSVHEASNWNNFIFINALKIEDLTQRSTFLSRRDILKFTG